MKHIHLNSDESGEPVDIKNNYSGIATFDTLSYKAVVDGDNTEIYRVISDTNEKKLKAANGADGEEIFYIHEVKGNNGGVTYDESYYKVVISVKDIKNNSKLDITKKVYKNDTEVKDGKTVVKKNGNGVDKIVFLTSEFDGTVGTGENAPKYDAIFTNTYSATGEYTLDGAKNMVGRKIKSTDNFKIHVEKKSATDLRGANNITDSNVFDDFTIQSGWLNNGTGTFTFNFDFTEEGQR